MGGQHRFDDVIWPELWHDKVMSPAALFLLQSILIIGLPYALWRADAVRRWAPLVVVQIAVGVALGPTGLGAILPEASAALFPAASRAALGGLVWLSLVYFAFATGLHFDLTEFHGRGRAFAVTSTSTIIVPFAAGLAAGGALYVLVPQAAGQNASPWAFAAGIGIAVGVTALPILAAILREMHLLKSRLGANALGCAAINDAALWMMLAALLAGARGQSALLGGALLAAAVIFAGLLWCCVRPALARLFAHAELHGRINERDVVVLSVGLFVAALVTEATGLSAMVGAFAFGAVVPKAVARDTLAKFESFLMVVLLPFFFIVTGMKTDFVLASGAGTVFVVTALVSVVAKLVSAALPARAFGASWRDSLALGSLVGCKGLMELVVLTMLLDAGILSPVGFSGMVLMALATTALATPLTKVILNRPAPH